MVTRFFDAPNMPVFCPPICTCLGCGCVVFAAIDDDGRRYLWNPSHRDQDRVRPELERTGAIVRFSSFTGQPHVDRGTTR